MEMIAANVQYITDTQGTKLAVIPADYYNELLKKYEEDFYYELSEEDLKILAISEKESELGEVKTHEKVSEKIRKYRAEKWK